MWIVTCYDPERWNGLRTYPLPIGSKDFTQVPSGCTFYSVHYVEQT